MELNLLNPQLEWWLQDASATEPGLIEARLGIPVATEVESSPSGIGSQSCSRNWRVLVTHSLVVQVRF